MQQLPKIILTLLVLSVIPIFSYTTINPTSDKAPSNSVELGEKLFFDPILSEDYSVSCGSCHKREFAFSDNVDKSKGVNGKQTKRNTPTIMYSKNRRVYFWDGRASTLEHQAFFPITDPNEMNLHEDEVIKRLSQSEVYTNAFQRVFNAKPSRNLVSKALADYQRTLAFYNSPYDEFIRGKDDALTESAIRGIEIFINKGKCFFCHEGTDQTTDFFFNIGLLDGDKYSDKGRFLISNDSLEMGSFKTPTLRNVELTAPYMHDGSMKTLEEVIDFYDQPDHFVKNSIARDTLLSRPLHLTVQEKADLKAFLLALTDKSLKN